MSDLMAGQRQVDHADLVRAVQALPADSLVLRAHAALVAELVEEVTQDIEDPSVVGEMAHKLAGRLGGIRAVAHRLDRWRTPEPEATP